MSEESYQYMGPSFDIKFENDVDAIKEIEICYRECKKGKEPPKILPIIEKSDYHFKFQRIKGTAKVPEDTKNWTFDFDDLKLRAGMYQLPFRGKIEEWRAMGFVGEPNRDWKRLGTIVLQCKKRRKKIVD